MDDVPDQHALAVAIGERLRAFREERGLGQAEVAQETGISRTQISRYEAGSIVPTLKTLVLFMRLIGRSLDYLVLGESDAEELFPNRGLRRRVLKIETMGPEAQRWMIDLMDEFIENETARANESSFDKKTRTGG